VKKLFAVLCILALSGCARTGVDFRCHGKGKNNGDAAREASEQTPPATVLGKTANSGPMRWGGK